MRIGVSDQQHLVKAHNLCYSFDMSRIILALFFMSVPAFGDVNQNGRTIDCYCTDSSGARVELGQLKCLEVDGRLFTAQCQMSLNVPMWREIQGGCLSSSLTDDVEPTAHAG